MNQDKNNQEGMEEIDLSGGLNDSDVKLENERQSERSHYPGTPKIIQWVIKYSGGSIKDKKQASYVVLGFVALAIIISIFLIFGRGGGVGTQKTFTPSAEAPLEEVIPLEF